jgi:hypothetical protein
MHLILCPERCISGDESDRNPDFARSRFGRDAEPATRRLTEEETCLVGNERNFLGKDGRQMYMRATANRGSQLRRRGATEACIVCGIPALPGTTAFAHIHRHDLHLSPCNDPTRVFCLCWHHHHGCYDQGYIATIELLKAEEIWIENKRRPKPHPRDIAMMKRIEDRDIVRQCAWTERRVDRRPTFHPGYRMPSHRF